MTTEFKNQLLGYAQEDINIVKEQGSLMISDTIYGLLTIEQEGWGYIAKNKLGYEVSLLSLEKDMIDFIANSYTIEQ